MLEVFAHQGEVHSSHSEALAHSASTSVTDVLLILFFTALCVGIVSYLSFRSRKLKQKEPQE